MRLVIITPVGPGHERLASRAEVARRLRFNESLDVGEDFDFYMRLESFVKVPHVLVAIGYDQPSAGGPRGGDNRDWMETCKQIVRSYR